MGEELPLVQPRRRPAALPGRGGQQAQDVKAAHLRWKLPLAHREAAGIGYSSKDPMSHRGMGGCRSQARLPELPALFLA